jgi:hypothetical protein
MSLELLIVGVVVLLSGAVGLNLGIKLGYKQCAKELDDVINESGILDILELHATTKLREEL